VGADYLISGSYQKVGERLQVNARLIKIETGEIEPDSLSQVQGNFDELFELQQRLAEELVGHLQPETANLPKIKKSIACTRSTPARAAYQRAKGREDQILSDQGLQASIDAYREAIEIDPKFALARAGLAERLAMRAQRSNALASDATEALQAADQAVALEPELAEAHHVRALALSVLKRPEEALQAARQAMALQNASRYLLSYLQLKYPFTLKPDPAHFQRLEQELKDLGADFKDPLILTTLAAGYISRFVNDPETDLRPALNMLEQALTARPDYVPALLMQATFYVLRQEMTQAAQPLRRLVALDPENPLLLYLGANMLRFSDARQALEWLQKALRLQPDLHYARLTLMELYQQQLKDMPACEQEFAHLKAQMPDNYQIYMTAAQVYLREKRYSEALNQLETVQRLTRNGTEQPVRLTFGIALKLSGDTYLAMQQEARAKATYQELLAVWPEPDLTRAMAHKALSAIERRQQHYGSALEHYTRLMQIIPAYTRGESNLATYRLLYLLAQIEQQRGSPPIWNDIGQNLLILKEPAEALGWLQKAQAADSRNAVIYYNLGVAFQQLNRPAEARLSWQKALTLRPDYLKAREALQGGTP
jgi:tetratricopeptide (TPR) repeat protein